MPSTISLSVAGIILCIYALYVEHKVGHKSPDEEFTALCDIESIGASCSAVFQLPQGHLMSYLEIVPQGHVLDVPNAALGMMYYMFQLLLSPMLPQSITIVAAMAAMSSSVFLAYHLTLISELCILCWTTHVINAFMLYNTVFNGIRKYKTKQA